MKKIVIITIAVLLLLSFNAFGGEKKDDTASGTYRFTFTYGWGVDQGAKPPSEAPNDPHFQWVENKLGIVPLTQPYDWDGGKAYIEGVRLQMSGGDIPEALQLFTAAFTTELIDSGVLIPLDDLLPKHAPDIWKFFTPSQWDLIRSFGPDGKIYFLPEVNNVPRVGMIRIDWLREVGINKVPETKAELLAALRAFKEKDANGNGDPNDEIPTSGRADMRWLDDMYVMHGCAMNEGYPQWRWDDTKKVMICDQVSDEMKNSVIWIRQLMEEGLMDQVMPIQPASDWFAKLADDKVGHYYHDIGGIPRRLAMRESGANPDAEWVYMPNVKVEGLPHQKNYAPGWGPKLGVTTTAKDPGKILEWFNYFGTEEGMLYSYFGIEGLNYTVENGKITPTDTPVSNKHLYNMTWLPRTRDVYRDMPFGDIIVNVYDACKDDYRFTDIVMMPSSVFDGYEDYATSKAALYKERCAKMILGELPMSAWDAYVKEWYDKGGTVVTKRVTDWYKKTYNK